MINLFIPIIVTSYSYYTKNRFPDLVTASKIILLSIPTPSTLVLALLLSHFYYCRHLLTRRLSSSSSASSPKWSVTVTSGFSLTITVIREFPPSEALVFYYCIRELAGQESSACSKPFFTFLILYCSLICPLPRPEK